MLPSRSENLVRWYCSLALAEGLVALYWLLLIPGEGGTGLRFTTSRLALALPLLSLVSLLAWLVLSLWRSPATRQRWAQSLSALAGNDSAYWGVLAASGAVAVICLSFAAMGGRTVDPFVKGYVERLTPYAAWGLVLSIQTLIFTRLLRYGTSVAVFSGYRKAFLGTLAFLAITLLLAGWMLWQRVGLRPDRVGWGIAGVPVLPAQVWLALAAVLGLSALAAGGAAAWRKVFRAASPRLAERTVDLLICLALWGGATWLWSSQPLKPNYFALEPVPPNQEYYPYSDATTYDLSAQKLLIGEGFERDVIRPMYSLFLAAAQGISGIGYQSVIAWQVPLLAAIPSLLYLLGLALHHRLSALLLGLLAILHERNAIALSGQIDVSHSKLLMSDLPITLGVVLFCLLAVHWLRRPGAKSIYPFLAGGVLGISMLIRTQVVVVLPPLLALAWFAYPGRRRQWLANSLILAAGLLIALVPWLWRNWSLTGEVMLADTSNVTQAGMVASRYSPENSGNIERLPGESEEAYLARMRDMTMQYIREHPLEVVRFTTSHFWHNKLSTVYVLPVSFPVLSYARFASDTPQYLDTYWKGFTEQCCSLETYVKRLPNWRRNWDGRLAVESYFPLLVTLVLVSVGAGVSWGRAGTASLVPLAVSTGYALGNALARNSGWRYNLPVDWVGMLYYSVGLVQACFWLGMYLANRFVPAAWEKGWQMPAPTEGPPQRIPWKGMAAAGLGFFLLTAAIPIVERAIPARYQGMMPQAMLASLQAEGVFQAAGIDPVEVERFMKQESATVQVGRALYPRFYRAGEGAPSTVWASYAARDFPRLGLYLIPGDLAVVLPVEQPPASLPNASDALILGCQKADYVEAVLLVVLDDSKTTIGVSPGESWDCEP